MYVDNAPNSCSSELPLGMGHYLDEMEFPVHLLVAAIADICADDSRRGGMHAQTAAGL